MEVFKFRIWDKKLGKFVVPTVNDEKIEGFISFVNKNGELVVAPDENNYIFKQFIGIQDKNNFDIFEGDIVQLSFRNLKCSLPLVVRYFPPLACYFLHNNLEEVKYWPDVYKTFQSIFKDDIEIVGNIMENPELIDNK